MTTPLEQCRAFDKTHGKALVVKLGRISDKDMRANEAAPQFNRKRDPNHQRNIDEIVS